MRRILAFWFFFAGATPQALALDSPTEMLKDPVQEERASDLGTQLRCLVCQNESIEDSSADLARDLRRVVRGHVARGESNAQIIHWMTQRYGDFILLKPRLHWNTLLLWGIPALALILGLSTALVVLPKTQKTPMPLSPEEKERLDTLLQETDAP